MERKIVSFVFSTSILSFAIRGNAFVPLPYEDLQSNFPDKYGDALVERSAKMRKSSGMFYIVKKHAINE